MLNMKQVLLGGTAMAVALSFAPSAFAQPASDTLTLETVIVTAEKRSEDVQKTPVAVTAVSNETLTRAGITQLANLEKVVPDVKLARQGAGMTVQVRGVWSTDNSPTSEAAVGVHVNGGYLAKTNGLQGFLYDLERIEVLKGPQGTLYGRNTNGGTVNIITAKASLDGKEAAAEVEYGNYNTVRVSGHMNMPLSDSVAARIAFQTFSHDGYMKSGLDDADEKEGRASFLWKPSENDSVNAVLDYSKVSNKGDGTFNVIAASQSSYTGPPPSSYNANVYVPADPRDDTFYNSNPTTGRADVFHRDQTNRGIMVQWDHGLDFANWTTAFNYRDFDGYPVGSNNIAQGTPHTITGASCTTAASGATTAPSGCYWGGARNYVPQHFESYSVETRLASVDTKPLQWVVGLYGWQDKDSGTMIGYGDLTTTSRSVEIANPYELAQSAALFAQATWTPDQLEDLHITAGGRLNVDHKQVKGIFTYGGGSTTYVDPQSRTWRAATYKVGLSYDITDSNMVYGSVSTGFKAGGYGYGPGLVHSQGPIYNPERITAFELGSKNRFLDDTLQLNVEAFYYKYKDYQTNLALTNCPSYPATCYGFPVLTVTSAGSATYKGITADVQYAITDKDLFRLTWSAISAKYGSYIVYAPTGYSLAATNGTTVPTAVTSQDYSHTNIPGVANWSGTASYSHTFDNVWGGSINAEVDTRFRGPVLIAQATYDYNTPGNHMVLIKDHPWSMWDMSLRYEPEDAAWSATAYVRNIADDTRIAYAAYSSTTGATSATFYDPRTFGIIFGMKL